MSRSLQSCVNLNHASVVRYTAMELHDVSPSRKLSEVSANYDAERYFIFKFETLSVLWNPQHKYYSSKYKRLEALKQLQKIYKRIKPGATVDHVRKKINALRSNYRRELRKIEASKKSAATDSTVYKPRLWSFQYLDFLKKAEHPGALLHRPKIKVKSEVLLQLDPGENSSSSEKETEESPPENTIFFPSFPLPKVESSSREETNFLDHSSVESSVSQNIFAQPKPSQTNCSNLASLWIEKLERLNPVQKLFAEKAINDILFEAELGNLKRNSVRINEPPVTESKFCIVSSPSEQPTPSSSYLGYLGNNDTK